MKPQAATPISPPSTANSSKVAAASGPVPSDGKGGTKKAGWSPKKARPMKVAAPVASATGKNAVTPISGIISSMANITPPIGVLKVAAIPAPAPEATRMIR